MSIESIKANLRRGWPYALASIVIYYLGITFLPLSPTFSFDVYLFFLKRAVRSSLLDLLIIGSLFFFLPLVLGWLDGALERTRINRVLATIAVTALGVITMEVISIIITTMLIGMAL